MSAQQLVIIGLIAVASFGWQAQTRKKFKHWVLDYASIGLMLGFMTIGVITLAVSRNLDTVVFIVWGYAPHAYNLVIWPILALFILRPRFGPAGFLLAFILAYGLDELIWNTIAFIYFGENASYLGYTTEYWHAFFVAVITGVAVSYYLLRPRIVPNWTWGFFAAYVIAYTLFAGLPTYVDEPFAGDPYVWAWELMWQVAIWIVIYGTLWSRRESAPTQGVSI